MHVARVKHEGDDEDTDRNYIVVTDHDPEDAIELPLEEDNSLRLSTLMGQFQSACGLKYKTGESRSFRGLR